MRPATGYAGEPVVVTGLGAVTAFGTGVETFWRRLRNGESGVCAITTFDVPGRVRIGAAVTGFTPDGIVSDKERQRLSLASQMGLVAAREALGQAGLLDHEARGEAGVLLGGSMSSASGSEPHFKRFHETGRVSPAVIPMCMMNAPAAAISIRFGLRGQQHTVDAACSSSAHAIGMAFHLIRTGLQPIIVTGGVDTTITPALLEGWASLRVLSERNDDPARACRPFNHDRDGFALGEGAAILVLESETSALARGATILARVLGYGFSSDAHNLVAPSEVGQVYAMERALASASLAPHDIDHVNAHGTATTLNDVVETRAIKKVFGAHAATIPVVSIKGAVGHLMGAAGAVEGMAAILATMHDCVPPTRNHDAPDPECDLDYVPHTARDIRVRTVLSNSFAFGGSNACLIVGKPE